MLFRVPRVFQSVQGVAFLKRNEVTGQRHQVAITAQATSYAFNLPPG